MFIKSGDILSISHHSSITFISQVIDVNDYENGGQVVTVKLTKDCSKALLFEGDTLAIAFKRNDEIYNTSCHITEINIDRRLFKLAVENEEYVINKRAFERFPVSIYAGVLERESKEQFVAVIKNISFDGLMMCTKKPIEENKDLDIKLYLDDETVTLTANVVWKINNEYAYDYGLKIKFMEYGQQNVMRRYIDRLKNKQISLIEGSN